MFEKLFQHWCGPSMPARPMLDDGSDNNAYICRQLPAIAVTLLSDGVNERMLRCAERRRWRQGDESWERPKARRSTSSKWL